MENLNAEREQITNPNNELYDYVKRIVAAVKYKGEGDHEDVPSILRKFAKGYEDKIFELENRLKECEGHRHKNSSEIKKAMVSFAPVRYDGIEYQKINAYIYRIHINPNTKKYKEMYQLELQSKTGNSVTIAAADKVELLEVI